MEIPPVNEKVPSVSSPSGKFREAISYQGHALIRWQCDGDGRVTFFLRDGFGFPYHNCKQFVVENTEHGASYFVI